MDLDRGIAPQPDDLQTLLASNSEIYIFSGSDHEHNLREKLNLEWENVPLLNPRLVEDIEGQADMTQRITLVHVTGFFTDGSDFIYYVKGGQNMSRFLLGTFSGNAYDKPCFATPCCVFDAQELLSSSGLDMFRLDRVSKTESKGIRWKYLYHSAVKAWEKLQIDEDKLERIRKREEWAKGHSEKLVRNPTA